ncbi:MAG TPA: transporter substrate-binding domain-containing protein [Kineosporiaceae bacterium]
MLGTFALAVRIQEHYTDGAAALSYIVPALTALIGFFATTSGRRKARRFPSRRTVVIQCFSSVSATLALVVYTIVFWTPWEKNEDSPSGYLGNHLVIGVAANRAGWSVNGGGFDVDLAFYLAEKLGYKQSDVTLKYIDDQGKRWSHDTTVGVLDTTATDQRVDMVIATFSMTSERAKSVDFAGPYYLDRTGIWSNLAKVDSKDFNLSMAQLCLESGTTADRNATNFITAHRGKVAGYQKDGITNCLTKFNTPGDSVAYVATDWSIVRLASPAAALGDAQGYRYPDTAWATGDLVVGKDGKRRALHTLVNPTLPPEGNTVTPEGNPGDLQRYGVAIRNGHPKLCMLLSQYIDEFLQDVDGYGKAFTTHLQGPLGDNNGPLHNPMNSAARSGINNDRCS